MKILLFTKAFAEMTPSQLADLARRLGVDGLDLCVRPGHCVQPDDLQATLPLAAKTLADRGTPIGMISAPGDLIDARSTLARTLCHIMARTDIRLLKIGYFPFDPARQDYDAATQAAVEHLARWEELAKAHDLTICYHSHAHQLGASAGMLVDLFRTLSTRHMAICLDPAQLLLQGEGLPAALAMLKGRARVAAIGLKDVLITPHAAKGWSTQWAFPGQGRVSWPSIARALAQSAFEGVLSAHVLMHACTGDRLEQAAAEVQFYRQAFSIP